MISLTQTFFDGIRIIMIVNPRGLYVLFFVMLISINIIKLLLLIVTLMKKNHSKRKEKFCFAILNKENLYIYN